MIEHITQEFLDSIRLPSPEGKKLSYLLVMPRIVTREDMTYQLPYGLCMVSAALKASGRNVVTLNLNYKKDIYSLLKETILKNSIDVIATGGLSGQYDILKEITDTAKEIKPDIITMVGGGIITADPLVAMEALETADYGMIGEGEITINALAHALENGEDPSLVEGVVVKNFDYTERGYLYRQEIKDLNILPFPDYDGFEYYMLTRDDLFSASGVQEKTAIIATGRSCPFNCTFCFHSSGKKYRRRSIENIFQEIDWIIKRYNVRQIMFVDELFASNIEFVKAIADGVKKRGLTYWVQTRVDIVSREMLQIMKDSGCYEVTFGVESADNRILKSMQKNITVEQIEQAFKWAEEVELPANGYIIFGDPEETEETIQTSLRWWKEHPNYDIRLWWILTFPGSHLYKLACERGIIQDRVQYLRENDTQLNLTKMSDETYWSYVKKVELYQMLVSDGITLDFDELDATAQRISQHLNELFENSKRVAIWPATLDNISMLNYVSNNISMNAKAVLVNVNPQDSFVLGTERTGKKVYTPDEAFDRYEIDTVLYAFGHRSSGNVYKQICGMIKKNYPSVERIVKLSDLLDK